MTTVYREDQRVTYDGPDSYPAFGTPGTVMRVVQLTHPGALDAAPCQVRWDTGGEGHYSASMLKPA